MSGNIINIMALIGILIGVLCVFWSRDILRDKEDNRILTTSGFVVSCVSLLIIYFLNR